MLSSCDNPRDINEIWQDIAEYRLYQLYLPDCRASVLKRQQPLEEFEIKALNTFLIVLSPYRAKLSDKL